MAEKTNSYEPITFGSAEEMLHYIRNNGDLYCPGEELYVFHYNLDGAIAVYDIDEEEAKDLSAKSIESDGEYWGAFLGFGGRIYDVPDEHCDDDYAMEFCEDHYNLKWYDTNDYAHKEVTA